MAVLSKWSKTLTCSCYELGHTWDPSCLNSTRFVAEVVAKTSLKIYFSLYLITAIYRKRGKEYFKSRLWLDTLRSTTFLTVNGSGFITFFCLFRRLCGGFTFLGTGFLSAFASSLLAICLERDARRGALALYLFNVALETAYRMAACRGLVPMIKNGEVLVFSLSAAVYMYYAKIKDGLDKSIQSGLRFLVGADEFPPPVTPQGGTVRPGSSKPPKWPRWLHTVIKLLQKLPKHDACAHNHSCLSYVLQGSSRNFVLGYAVQAAVQCLKSFTSILRKPSTLTKSLLHMDNVGLGAFLALFSGSFRAVNCLLRWLRNKDDPLHGAVAGLVAGWSMLFYKSSSITMYVLAKLLEILYVKGAENKILPTVPQGKVLVYTLSTALVFHAVVFEPHNIRPAYWRFLLKVTGGRFAEVNRRLLDVYGTNASKINPNFWPKYDPRYSKLVEPL